MGLYQHVIRPGFFLSDAESAHHRALAMAGLAIRGPLRRLIAARHRPADPRLRQTLWKLDFPAPVGLAAGLDKNAVAVPALAAFGCSHIEVGTITGEGQPGNPKPRLFRLVADAAVINRMGFNNEGAAAVADRIRRELGAPGDPRRPCVLGINLGKTKLVAVEAALDDYLASVRQLAPLADYLVVNVSSPNTPGLRDLQAESMLRPLLAGIRAGVDRAAPGCPLLLKIAPDLADAGVDAAVDVALETGCDGLICTNTTIARPELRTPAAAVAACGAGGLSGPPVAERSTAVLARAARRIRASPRPIPLIGVGGVDSAAAAWRKIGAGASLVQVYTGLIYHGPGLVAAIHRGLSAELDRCGLPSLAAAVGRDL